LPDDWYESNYDLIVWNYLLNLRAFCP
jgi:hypothetical protein